MLVDERSAEADDEPVALGDPDCATVAVMVSVSDPDVLAQREGLAVALTEPDERVLRDDDREGEGDAEAVPALDIDDVTEGHLDANADTDGTRDTLPAAEALALPRADFDALDSVVRDADTHGDALAVAGTLRDNGADTDGDADADGLSDVCSDSEGDEVSDSDSVLDSDGSAEREGVRDVELLNVDQGRVGVMDMESDAVVMGDNEPLTVVLAEPDSDTESSGDSEGSIDAVTQCVSDAVAHADGVGVALSLVTAEVDALESGEGESVIEVDAHEENDELTEGSTVKVDDPERDSVRVLTSESAGVIDGALLMLGDSVWARVAVGESDADPEAEP